MGEVLCRMPFSSVNIISFNFTGMASGPFFPPFRSAHELIQSDTRSLKSGEIPRTIGTRGTSLRINPQDLALV